MKKCSLLNFRRELVCEIVENYMETKCETAPITSIKYPLIRQRFSTQCVNNKKSRRCAILF